MRRRALGSRGQLSAARGACRAGVAGPRRTGTARCRASGPSRRRTCLSLSARPPGRAPRKVRNHGPGSRVPHPQPPPVRGRPRLHHQRCGGGWVRERGRWGPRPGAPPALAPRQPRCNQGPPRAAPAGGAASRWRLRLCAPAESCIGCLPLGFHRPRGLPYAPRRTASFWRTPPSCRWSRPWRRAAPPCATGSCSRVRRRRSAGARRGGRPRSGGPGRRWGATGERALPGQPHAPSAPPVHPPALPLHAGERNMPKQARLPLLCYDELLEEEVGGLMACCPAPEQAALCVWVQARRCRASKPAARKPGAVAGCTGAPALLPRCCPAPPPTRRRRLTAPRSRRARWRASPGSGWTRRPPAGCATRPAPQAGPRWGRAAARGRMQGGAEVRCDDGRAQRACGGAAMPGAARSTLLSRRSLPARCLPLRACSTPTAPTSCTPWWVRLAGPHRSPPAGQAASQTLPPPTHPSSFPPAPPRLAILTLPPKCHPPLPAWPP